MAPIAIIVVSAFLLTGFLKIASYITNKIRPPSSAGIGIKFIIPKFTLNNAVYPIKLMIPALTTESTLCYIPTGPFNISNENPPVNILANIPTTAEKI